jgi:hypothetical protein
MLRDKFAPTPHDRNIPLSVKCRGQCTAQEYVCWSRMQAEAGQDLSAILQRKEIERRAGNGQFFWGVGNAPAVMVSAFSRMKLPVEVIFSTMKTRPKPVDSAPSKILVWRRYVGRDGGVRPLPPNALVTSRADTFVGPKTKHFALMCFSRDPLKLQHGEPFDPHAFRNASEAGASVGASQVTALLRRISASTDETDYEVNLRATMVGDYWVRLADPIEWRSDFRALDALTITTKDWLEFVGRARQSQDGSADPGRLQHTLF